MEVLQPSGSYKLLGIGHACEVYKAKGARRILSSSAGNAGLAVAYAGRRLGIPVVVYVPEKTPDRLKNLLLREGAEVVTHGATWQEAHDQLLAQRDPADAMVHPFDDPLLWQGHASLVYEAADQGPKPQAVVLAVGGGGLMCGVLQGMHEVGWSDVPLVAIETLGAHSLSSSMAAGAPVRLKEVTSIATSLGVNQVCRAAFDWTQRHQVHAAVVSDDSAVAACLSIADEHRVIVEPACGAAVAAVLERRSGPLLAAEDVLLVLCGGITTTYADLMALVASQPRMSGKDAEHLAAV